MCRFISLMLCSLALFLPSCRKESPAPTKGAGTTTSVIPENENNRSVDARVVLRPKIPFFMERSTVGSTLNPKGEVESDDTMVRAGAPVSLTLYLKESPPGLQVGAVWYHDDKALRHDVKPANGAKILTFTLDGRKLAPGRYRVVGYWGGNVAADKQFEIVGKAKKAS